MPTDVKILQSEETDIWKGRVKNGGILWDSLNMTNMPESKWQEIFRKENADLLARNQYMKTKINFLRPPMITTYECKNVLIEGVSISNPPFWTIMPAFTENITITGITIENPGEFAKY